MMKKILALFLGGCIGLCNASDYRGVIDQKIYDRGVKSRKAGLYKEAKRGFAAAVFAQDPMLSLKAQYNLGYISYREGRIQDASFWFAQSNQAHIALKGVPFQPAVKASQILLTGNMLSFLKPSKEVFFAPNRTIGDLFSKVQVSSDITLSLKYSFTVKDGDLEVHFRDADHLKALLEIFPLFSGERTFYVRDENVKDGTEFRVIGGTGFYGKFVHIEGDEGLKIFGSIPYMPFTLVLPKQTDWQYLSINCSGLETTLSSLDNSLRLLSYLGDISNESIAVQGKKALALLKEGKADRKACPEKYPSLEEVSPGKLFFSDAPIDETQEDYVTSTEKPFYVGHNKTTVEKLKGDISIYRGTLFFIDSNLSNVGLYAGAPLRLLSGFKVHTRGNFVIAGDITVPNNCLTLLSDKCTWVIGANIDSLALTIRSRLTIRGPLLILPIEKMERPEEIPDNLWDAFYKHYLQ